MKTTVYYTIGKEQKRATFTGPRPLRTLFEDVKELGGDPQNFEFTRAGGYCSGHYRIENGELTGVSTPRFITSNVICKE